MHNFISAVILNKIRSSKKLDADLLKAKKDLQSKKRLPNGIMTNAEAFAGLEAAVMRNFMENNARKLQIHLFVYYVNEHFDSIASTLKEKNLSFKKEGPSSSLSAQPGPSSSSVQPVQDGSNTKDEYRTFSISINKALRKDLPKEIEEIVKTKLESSIKNASDYYSQFLLVVNSIVIIMKSTAFVVDSDGFHVESSEGYNILGLLPDEFVQRNSIQPLFSSMPLPKDIPNGLREELGVLFTDQHLSLIASHCFGSGARSSNLQKYLVESFFFEELEKNGIKKDTYKNLLKQEEKVAVTTKIMTNIKNMWVSNNIFTKLLDRLVSVLLKLHLADSRANDYMSYIAEKKKEREDKKEKGAERNVPVVSSNRRRELVRKEYKKKKLEQKLQKMADKEKQEKCKHHVQKSEQRINFFKSLRKDRGSVLPSTSAAIGKKKENDDLSSAEKEVKAIDDESSRSRLKSLKFVAKHLLLSLEKPPTIERLKKEIPDGTEKEVNTLDMLIRILKP
ncbi:hypothetical protein INT48_000474 [Thamnidium elegans]|uniref:Uncharacterized protein n=1 Tax=Thamnidium elegans TaxID=101142 RepID=A0A8H7SUC7_9FUNG|nr:hypothetical protein INT48_000474 [Thamnidium elegans]